MFLWVGIHLSCQFEIPEPEGLRFDAVLEASRSRRKYLRQVDKLKKRLVKDNTHQYIADFERQVAPEVGVAISFARERVVVHQWE